MKKKPKKTVLSIIGSKCENVDEKIIKEEDPNEILKLLSLIKNNYVKNMAEDNISQEFWMKKKKPEIIFLKK